MNFTLKNVRLFLLLLLVLTSSYAGRVDAAPLSKSMLRGKLFRAVKGYGNLDQLKKILEAGADINARDNYKRTVLMKAIVSRRGHHRYTIIQYIIDSGVDVNAREVTGETALMQAKVLGDEKVVDMLLKAGAAISPSDQNAVYKVQDEEAKRRAVYKARLGKARRLREGEVKNAAAAKKAVKAKRVKIAAKKPVIKPAPKKKAVAAKVTKSNVTSAPSRALNTKLFKALRGRGNLFYIQEIVKSGAAVNARDNYDRTPLMLAVGKFYKFQKLAIINFLIDSGADVNARDEMGKTALMKSLILSDREAVNILKDAGAVASKEDLFIVELERREIAQSREEIKKKVNNHNDIQNEVKIGAENQY